MLLPLMAAWSAIVPEHVHERDAHHGEPQVHRHLAPHHAADAHRHDHADIEALHDHEHAHAGRVVWLTAVSLHQVAYHLDLPPALAAAAIGLRPPATTWIATPFNDAAPAHGPPRPASSLRGPPAFPA